MTSYASIRKRIRGGGQLAIAARFASSRRLRVLLKSRSWPCHFFPTGCVRWVASGSIRQEDWTVEIIGISVQPIWADIHSCFQTKLQLFWPDLPLWKPQLLNFLVLVSGNLQSRCRWSAPTTSNTSSVWWTRTWRVRGTPCSPSPPSRVSAAGSPTLLLRR